MAPKQETPQPNPFKEALSGFETALASGDFNVGIVMQALNKAEAIGFQTAQEPSKLFPELSKLANKAAKRAKALKDPAESEFKNLAAGFDAAAENFALVPKPPKNADDLKMTDGKG